jgi:hypothetical protein
MEEPGDGKLASSAPRIFGMDWLGLNALPVSRIANFQSNSRIPAVGYFGGARLPASRGNKGFGVIRLAGTLAPPHLS